MISRSIEIIVAFFRDVTSKQEANKKTNLDKFERIKLAVMSYLELIILYALVYSFFGQYSIRDFSSLVYIITSFLENLIVSFGTMTLTDSNLTMYFENGYFYDIGSVKYLMALQMLTAIVLSLFALASYLGSKNGKT